MARICPECGKNLALVGRVHRCASTLRTQDNVVPTVTHKKQPRSPKSNAQRQREWRERNMNKQLTLQRARMAKVRANT